MGFLNGLFRRKEETRAKLLQGVTDMMAEEEAKPEKFFSMFGDVRLATGQTADNALAEWHALQVSILHYGLVCSLETQEKVTPMMDLYRAALARRLGPACRSIFVKVVSLREREYLEGFYETLSKNEPGQTLRFFGSIARRVSGHYDEQREIDNIPHPDGPDVITITAFSRFITDCLISTKRYADNLQEKAPKLFSGSMDG
jgi:hypothetical protein